MTNASPVANPGAAQQAPGTALLLDDSSPSAFDVDPNNSNEYSQINFPRVNLAQNLRRGKNYVERDRHDCGNLASNSAATTAHLPSRFQPHPTNLYRIEERKEEQTVDCNIEGDVIKSGQDMRDGSNAIVV